MKQHLSRLLTVLSLACVAVPVDSYAQPPEITTYLPTDKANYEAYPITNYRFFDIGDGYLAAGNRSAGPDHASIHLLRIPQTQPARNARGSLIRYNETDVRVIATTIVDPKTLAITIQARTAGKPDRVLVTLLDVSLFGSTPTILNTIEVQSVSGSLYPMSATLGPNGILYVSGFHTYTTSYPTEPDFVTTKDAFVASVLLNGTGSFINLYNTQQNLTPPPPNTGWNGQFNDYDNAMRVSYRNGHLYVGGSSNGTSQTNWLGGTGVYAINASKSWAAELDPNTLTVINQGFFGTLWTGSQLNPSVVTGYYGLDLLDDPTNPGECYMVGNDYYWHTWYVSHVDAAQQLSPAGANGNAVWYAYPADIRSFGGYSQGNSGRITIYGPHGANYLTSGFNAIPFSIGMNMTYNPAPGIGFSNPQWYVDYNATGFNPGFTATRPFWLNNLSQWSLVPWSAQANPQSNKYDLATMGHFLNAGINNITPRFIQGNADGWVSTCPGSTHPPIGSTIPGITLLTLAPDFPVAAEYLDHDPLQSFPKPNQLNLQHLYYECSVSQPYRMALNTKPATEVISVYPNPATSNLTVTWDGYLGEEDKLSLILLDMSGRTVAKIDRANISGKEGRFDLPGLSPGMYMATFMLNGRASTPQKLSIR